MAENTMPNVVSKPNMMPSPLTIQKWGALAAILFTAASLFSETVYLMGNLRDADGPFSYAIADLMYGPVRAACLITLIYALREHIGGRAPRLMSLVLMIASLSAAMFVATAMIRASNRHYHLSHPDLNLEHSETVQVVWGTLVAGVIATAWHLWGWSLVLLGAAGWVTRRLPRLLCVLIWVIAVQALMVYQWPDLEGSVIALGLVMCLWLAIVLWRSKPEATPAPIPTPSM